MKDSLFDDKPIPRKFEINAKKSVKGEEKRIEDVPKKNENINELDNLIDELNDVVGGEIS
jgi:hypothetical protein